MYKFCFDEHIVSTKLFDHASHVLYFFRFVTCTLSFMYFLNVLYIYIYIYIYIYVVSITVLWSILNLMPATSYPKAIGGVC